MRLVGQPDLLQRDRDLHAVRRGKRIKLQQVGRACAGQRAVIGNADRSAIRPPQLLFCVDWPRTMGNLEIVRRTCRACDRTTCAIRCLEGDDRIRAAESEAVADRGAHLAFAGHVRRNVKIAVGVPGRVVRGGRDYALADGHHAGDHFQRPGCAHAVGVHGFRRRYRQLVGVCAEHFPDRARLGLVVGLGAGAMRVHVVDILRRKSGVGETGAHRRRRALRAWAPRCRWHRPTGPHPASSARIGAPRALACS